MITKSGAACALRAAEGFSRRDHVLHVRFFGVACKVGMATRTVRVVIISAGSLLESGAGNFDVEMIKPAIYLLATPTRFTVLQRIPDVRREVKRLDADIAAALHVRAGAQLAINRFGNPCG